MMVNIVHKIGHELNDWRRISEILQSENLDAKTLFDTLDGETELVEALCIVAESIQEDEIMLEGLGAKIAELTSRKSRIAKAIESKRNLILSAMDSAAIPTIKGPLFTLTARATAPKPVILDESEIPSDYWLPQPPKLDKKTLAASLKDGQTIPGVELDNGGLSLTMRVK